MANRPRNISPLDLMHYKFPVTAIASILHRISGLILFLLIPYFMWVLEASLASEASFNALKEHSHFCLFIVWGALSALWYHILAGIKHLVMDWGFCESQCAAKFASWLVIILGVTGAICLGVWLW